MRPLPTDKEKRPNLVFIMETKLRQYKLELIKYKIEFFGLFVVDDVGSNRGLALLWGDGIDVCIQNYS